MDGKWRSIQRVLIMQLGIIWVSGVSDRSAQEMAKGRHRIAFAYKTCTLSPRFDWPNSKYQFFRNTSQTNKQTVAYCSFVGWKMSHTSICTIHIDWWLIGFYWILDINWTTSMKFQRLIYLFLQLSLCMVCMSSHKDEIIHTNSVPPCSCWCRTLAFHSMRTYLIATALQSIHRLQIIYLWICPVFTLKISKDTLSQLMGLY